ncbi:MAG: carbohydrate ABC transporter permease [Clostridia bacterium]|nr:carbohydrate ABC transporter permease [Clostridia bacterium]
MTITQICIYIFVVLALLALFSYIGFVLVKKAKQARKVGKKIFTADLLLQSIVFCVLLVYLLTIFAALFWGVMTSLKSLGDFGANYLFDLPEKLAFSNYVKALKLFKVPVSRDGEIVKITFLGLVVNSVIYSVGKTLVQLLCPAIVAYLVARFDFKFGRIIYWIVIMAMILPIVGTTHSAILLYTKLNIRNNIFGVLLGDASFLGMYFLIFHGVFKTLPKDYAEAAILDGAGNTTIMFKIMFPLIINMLTIVAVLLFISVWNDYTTIMYFLPAKPNLAYGLYLYNINPDGTLSQTPLRLVGCMVMCLPCLTLFLIFKNKMIGNLSLGGLKG